MQASRRLLSPSALKGFLIPPQTTWGILGSAGQTCYRLLEQTQRDSFLDTINRGVINTQVLGQADIGFWRILALYNDLNDPLFRRYDFDAEQFSSGAKLALERFHDVQQTLQESLHSKEEETTDKGTDESNADEPASDLNGELVRNATLEAGLIAALGGDSGSKELQQILKQTWAKEAEENPDSLAAEMMAMVTPEYFHGIEISLKTNYILEQKLNYTADSGKITNIALLSARAMPLPSPEADDEKDSIYDDDAPMKDPSLENSPANEEDPPIVAQIEILYDVEQTFSAKATNGDGGDSSDASHSGEQSVPRTTVLVGVFQGWLHGDPDGNECVRWRLALNRPAWEFPYLLS